MSENTLTTTCPECWGDRVTDSELGKRGDRKCETCGGEGEIIVMPSEPTILDAVRLLDLALAGACDRCFGSDPWTCDVNCLCSCHHGGAVPKATLQLPRLCPMCQGVPGEDGPAVATTTCGRCAGKGWVVG